MYYSPTILLECPHCEGKCQFIDVEKSHHVCRADNHHHITFICKNCNGLIVTKWYTSTPINVAQFRNYQDSYDQTLLKYYPIVGDWNVRVDLKLIVDELVRSDFSEAIECYNNGFYTASMIMARRAIQQEMINKNAIGDNLYQQIESTGLSTNLKQLLQKVKNFGNHGAHPDFALYDNDGNVVSDKQNISKLSLEFLDRYFADVYEIQDLISKAPKSEKELSAGD